MDLLLIAIAVLVASGIMAFVASRAPRVATTLGAGGATVGCIIGLVPTLSVLLGGSPESLHFAWDAAHGAFAVEIDALSSFFLLPVLGLSALAAIYGSNYLLAYRREKSLGPPWFFFNAFVAGMAMVLIARTAVLFLIAWEIMSISAYFLVAFEHEKEDVRRAGWIYLIATHLGVAFLFVAFLLLGRQAGGLEFEAFRTMPALSAAGSGVVFVLALIGFGAKAGLVPFHVWLPEAHPAAPSHISALMSGVMIKLGLYGLIRIASFLGEPAAWWGATLALLGLLTALVGIALAVYQRDMKGVLAYSSIENIGLIVLALGLGWWGQAVGQPLVAVLGMTAALLHIWNHALMKGLMFFAAGSVLHGAGSKDMEKLGGLMRRMPWTGAIMMIGAVAIAALPPMNGFVSKWLIYLSLIRCGLADNDIGSLTALLSVGLLALVGGLAAFAYVRLTGIVLLGSPRSESADHAHESSFWMLGPMLLLIAVCLAAAVAPQRVVGLLANPLSSILSPKLIEGFDDSTAMEAPLQLVGAINMGVIALVAVLAAILFARVRRTSRTGVFTWGCGYIRPSVRMQYSGRSFAEILGENLLPRFFRPRTTGRAPAGLFPAKSDFSADDPDPITGKIVEPFFRRWADRFVWLRILQQGNLNIYLIYIALTVALALVWDSLRAWWNAL